MDQLSSGLHEDTAGFIIYREDVAQRQLVASPSIPRQPLLPTRNPQHRKSN